MDTLYGSGEERREGAQDKLASFIMQAGSQISWQRFHSPSPPPFPGHVIIPPPSPAPFGRWPGPDILERVSGGASGSACTCTPCRGRCARSGWSGSNEHDRRLTLSIAIFPLKTLSMEWVSEMWCHVCLLLSLLKPEKNFKMLPQTGRTWLKVVTYDFECTTIVWLEQSHCTHLIVSDNSWQNESIA